MRIMYAVCSWGFGHVTRSLPIIRRLLEEGHEMTLVACGPPKYMLEQEVGHLDNQVTIEEVSDYPLPYTSDPDTFLFKFLGRAPKMILKINSENDWVIAECEKRKYDIIVSDNRYGIFHKKVPSFLMTHQLRMLAPKRSRFMEWGTEKFVSLFQRYFTRYIIPDFEEDDLAGVLCHDMKLFDEGKVAYIGPISDFVPDQNKVKDLDGYISVSGPEPQRGIYEALIRKQLDRLKGNWVMSLGKKKGENEQVGDVKIIPYLTKEERTDIMSRTDLIVSRSGYTTIMDICMGGQKALFCPTPGQTEQEYLSEYHNEKGTFYSVDQEVLDLKDDVPRALAFKGIKRGSTDDAVEKAMDVLFGSR